MKKQREGGKQGKTYYSDPLGHYQGYISVKDNQENSAICCNLLQLGKQCGQDLVLADPTKDEI